MGLAIGPLLRSVLAAGALAASASAQPDTLEVRQTGSWRPFWVPAVAPARWTAADPNVRGAVRWAQDSGGIRQGALDLRTHERGRMVRVIVVEMDPARVSLSLHARVGDGELLPWRVGDAPAGARVAFNAGQFTDDGPWGWVVHHGREQQPVARGPLSMALVVDSSGGVHLVSPPEIPQVRGVREALQTYPALLVGDGEVPPEVRGAIPGLDTGHRDTRLAVGLTRDGRLLLVLTRLVILGATLGPTPLGLTVAETAALLGALGAKRAVMLDGGLSSQLMVRHASGHATTWQGLRAVPLGVVVR